MLSLTSVSGRRPARSAALNRRREVPAAAETRRSTDHGVLVSGSNLVTGFAWYRREQWSRLREVASDRDKLDDSYAEWLAGAQKALLEMALADVPVKRVDVDVDALLRWCQAEGRPVDSAARAAFVADELRRTHPT